MSVDRRSILAGAAGAVVVPALPGLAAGAGATTRTGAAGQPLPTGTNVPRSIPLADGWRFALVNPGGVTDPTGAYAGAADPAYDDSRWRAVRVPHDWSIEQTPTTANGTSGGTGYLPGGLGWYRRTFTLPPQVAGRRISVEFDGVYMDSDVYCNGTLLGNHPYGYTGFAHDITDLVHTDGSTPNVIAVTIRNQLPSSRWYSGSGIYRHARLVVTDPVHVTRWGTFVTTPDLATTAAQGYGTVHAEVSVADDSGAGASAVVVATVRDAKDHRVARTSAPLELPAGRTAATAALDLRVDQPALWSPDTPDNRYTLVTEVQVAGRTVDTYTTGFGFRWLVLDPDQGLSINGVPAKIRGVDLHHDQGALGSAIHEDAVLRQMTIMKSMGVNAFRTSHNPPSPQMIQACEELGIVMMVEAFDCWHTGKTTYDYHRFFDANSTADITEMVLAARNSPAVMMWSIGNEIPDSTSSLGLTIADGLIAAIKAVDTTRPVVIGSDKYRGLPAVGSAADKMLAKLDGLGLNYNTAASVDALHARYPHLFLFESESSSETSSRGTYQEPQHLNTGENHVPGKRATSSFDNNLASWTMSGEYGLKKDRDRKFFAGEFLWSGTDYIGEPTPYSVFPVKSSFFGAVDTAGFPKDMYWLFRSQWTSEPMVHLLPMDWTDHAPGETVEVWAYANVDTVELFVNGASMGTRTFDRKKTVDGRGYLETTEATGDDKTVTGGAYPGSYTSPNGSAGKLHLTWQVPFAPGELKAVARSGGRVVATDVLRTAGAAHAVRLTADRDSATADGDSLVYVTAEVVDAHGVVLPNAAELLTFDVAGGSLAGLDNGRQESAERYQATTRTTFGGKALAIVRTGTEPGGLTVTATAPGLHKGSVSVRTTKAHGPVATTAPVRLAPDPGPGPVTYPAADASYSGSESSLPAAMVDGNPATGWSNAFNKSATALLPAFSGARPGDWVSVAWADANSLSSVSVSFTVDATHSLPGSVTVSYWDRDRWVPVSGQSVAWATASDAPTVISFTAVHTDRLRLDMVSAAPGTTGGAQRISTLTVG
ncbi:glycoside hydrolase family 2 TIM barrel-domain containing protein [Actinacidiphila acididurans]|uniref:DUF4982 domain-containing protein n=1 Tax=Actinacidiphila acididurans TaxID=2784346 RepID=A0ABS2U464_9ACTN|nr:glycoside hydrolase family 2 TIM barrel-domain containing protein [Actinacidiphila acididurans]MBM9510407.1 DUF4982 domain-containing protein [Actinacidiphila acididurans]